MNQELALKILLAGHSALLTGPAGSGKTYTLNRFIDYAKDAGKKVAVTATTGLAATHLGGNTIHSWSGIGVHDYLPEGFIDKIPKTRRETIIKTEVLIIENKIKSIPTKEQLMRYEEELGKQDLTITGILTGLYASLDIQELGKWLFLSYHEIAKRIMNIQEVHATMDFADYIQQYAEDIEVLYDLFQSKMEQNKGKYIIGDKDLEKIRYSDIYVKLKGSEFMEEINKRLTFEAYKDWVKPVCGLSFNHKKPTLSIVFSQRIDGDPTKEIGMIGVQIEGDQFRIYGGASQEGNYHEKVVIEKLYDCDYFKRNFAEKISKQGRTSKMRNNYCKYGNIAAKYCHCYQYWKIEDFSYDAIIDELIKQMRIAEEKIKNGLTFGE